jgi:hypothetical protein
LGFLSLFNITNGRSRKPVFSDKNEGIFKVYIEICIPVSASIYTPWDGPLLEFNHRRKRLSRKKQGHPSSKISKQDII